MRKARKKGEKEELKKEGKKAQVTSQNRVEPLQQRVVSHTL
jgi:hypothetical protein